MPPRRRSFTPEYRAKAAHMVIDGHRRVAEVARELDLHKDLLYTWVRDERWRMAKVRSTDTQWTDPTAGQPLSVQERAELVRLRATVAQQAKEIAFLEEASAHFAAAASKVSRFHELMPAECVCRDVNRIAELLDVSTSKPPPKRARFTTDSMANSVHRDCHLT
ncbi:transposase [Mycolicibacter sp. MYC123]|nr:MULTISPECIES: transposase [Mycobacteriaceae]MCV7386100.1 transposase [Mycolicibacter longobardus]MEB3050355.1 transposase [Mycolicibacter sp. MYC123]ULP48430.2 transposase [Mycolicibacter virginiensis]